MKGREAMLQKLLSTIPEEYEKIVVDDEDLLLAAKRNKGAKKATGEYLLFIDDDNYLASGVIEEMLSEFKKKIGVMGMTACYDDKKMKVADGGSKRNYLTGFTSGFYTNELIYEIPYSLIYQVDEVANAFMIPRHVFEEVGGFDEVNFPIDLDEADLCKRIKDMGYQIVMNPKAICYHKSQTYSPVPDFRRPFNAYTMGRNKVYYQRKHLSFIAYSVYLICFFWMTPFFYSVSLLYRGKLKILFYFLWGVIDGVFKPLMSKVPEAVFGNTKME